MVESELMNIVQMVSWVATAIGVCVAAIYYILNLRNTQKNMQMTLETRQAQLFMQIYDRQTDPEFQKRRAMLMKMQWIDCDDFIKKYGDYFNDKKEANMEVYSSLWSVQNYLEGIGVLVKRRLIDPTLVDDLISGMIIRMWEKFRPLFLEFRKRYEYPQFEEWTEYLYEEIKAIAVKQHPELRK
jgi:hypothetical protein